MDEGSGCGCLILLVIIAVACWWYWPEGTENDSAPVAQAASDASSQDRAIKGNAKNSAVPTLPSERDANAQSVETKAQRAREPASFWSGAGHAAWWVGVVLSGTILGALGFLVLVEIGKIAYFAAKNVKRYDAVTRLNEQLDELEGHYETLRGYTTELESEVADLKKQHSFALDAQKRVHAEEVSRLRREAREAEKAHKSEIRRLQTALIQSQKGKHQKDEPFSEL